MPNDIETAQAASEAIGRLIAKHQAEVAGLRSDLEDYEHAQEKAGRLDAAVAAAELRAAVADRTATIQGLQQERQTADNRLRVLVQEQQFQIELERRRTQAALAPQYLEAAREADALATALGQKLNLLAQLGRSIAQSSENPDARRLLGFTATKERVLQSFYLHFFLQLDLPSDQSRATAMLHWFGWNMNTRANCNISLAEREQGILDGVVDIFSSETVARETASRLDPTGLSAHVLPLPGYDLFKVMRVTLRGAAARLAKRGAGR